MSLTKALQASASYPRLESFDHFRENIPPEWIDEALEATGVATLRRRRLPVEQMVWLVLGIALFRDRAIEEVVDKLNIALPGPGKPVAKSAVPKARQRLGAEPMQWLFHRTARQWAHESAAENRWRGLAVYGVDGSSLRTADTAANREAFGGWTSGKKKRQSSNPLVRVVVLMALRSHLLAAAGFGAYAANSEIALTTPLLAEIPAQSLTIFDGLFLSAALLLGLQGRGEQRHWMTRAKSTTRMREVVRFGPGDALVEMTVSDEARKQDPSLPRKWRARAIGYQRPGYDARVLLTSLLDPAAYPADELRALYHERWELELGYDEIKTELLDSEITLRSKSPQGVQQELWGILLGFNLIRLEMARIAREIDVAPTRISFVAALHLIRDEVEWSAITRSPGAIPRHLAELSERLKRLVLPPRRSTRNYPRTVKNDYRRYPRRPRLAAS